MEDRRTDQLPRLVRSRPPTLERNHAGRAPRGSPRFDQSPHTVRGSFNSLAAPPVVRVLRSPGLKRLAGVAESFPAWREPGWRVRSRLGILRFRPRPIRIGRDAPARWAEDSSLLGSPGPLASEHGTDERRAIPSQPVLWKRRLAPLRQEDCTERLTDPDASGGLRSTSLGSCVHGTCGTARAGEATTRTRGLWSMWPERAAGSSGMSVLQCWLGVG